MLKLTLKAEEYYDSETNRILDVEPITISLEHSLRSISKWEQKFKKVFFDDVDKTTEETFEYIKCMIVEPVNFDPNIVYRLTDNDISSITDYINDKMTATWFNEREGSTPKKTSEKITAETIYYWMFSLNIPLEWEERHINTLLTLIRLINVKNGKQKPMSQKEIMAQNRALNAKRRAMHHSKG